MKASHVIASVLILLVITGPWSSTTAEPILYAINFVASGTVDGVPFSDELLVFAGVTDTDTVAAIAEANLAPLQQLIKNNPTQVGFAVEVNLPGPLTLPAVREETLVTLMIDSILNDSLELRTRHVAGGL